MSSSSRALPSAVRTVRSTGSPRTLVANMVEGVTKGFEKHLEIQGVGYRAQLKGADLELSVGFSHPVTVTPRAGISFDVPQPTQVIVKERTSRSSGRRPPRSARCARPSRTRARASATRASTCGGRSGSAHEHHRSGSTAPPSSAGARKVSGTAERPRLVVFRSNKGIFAQLVDDEAGRTLASASWLQNRSFKGTKTDQAAEVGKALAAAAMKAGIRRCLRPGRIPLPRTREGARRGRAREDCGSECSPRASRTDQRAAGRRHALSAASPMHSMHGRGLRPSLACFSRLDGTIYAKGEH